jgi:hypothetical protein
MVADDPESNRFLVELKRRWDSGKYDQDREGIYPVDMTLQQASVEVSRRPKAVRETFAREEVRASYRPCIYCWDEAHAGVKCPQRPVEFRENT